MDAKSSSTVDFEKLEESLAKAIAGAQSLDEIAEWLKSQPGVESVQLANYLAKSNPPQRDFIVEFRTGNDSTTKKIVNIFDRGNQQFEFRKLRDS